MENGEKLCNRKFGQDGITRTVKLKTAAGMMKQPTMNLHLIEPLRIEGWECTTPMGREDSNNKRKDSVVDVWNLMISTVEMKKNEKEKNIGRLIGRRHGVPALRDASHNTYWQTNGPLPHLLTLYFNRLTLISHLCIYVDTDVDGSYTPKTLSIRRGTQLCDMVENVLVHLANFKGWAVIPLCARGRNFVSAFILQIAILANHLNGRDSCIRQIKVFGPKFEWKNELVSIMI
ncbi:Anaphase-promoting complex subunit 10 [Trichinella murrelli]|uniref:Anaphase-promoting complex subunit 10 n=1 Tax=Trichinella murrelli TaxID=144512 RepID=A0A0V0T8G5_9BILA|nr:Anaphase-promoting complex subunit 10 [Trichinella murrelli]